MARPDSVVGQALSKQTPNTIVMSTDYTGDRLPHRPRIPSDYTPPWPTPGRPPATSSEDADIGAVLDEFAGRTTVANEQFGGTTILPKTSNTRSVEYAKTQPQSDGLDTSHFRLSTNIDDERTGPKHDAAVQAEKDAVQRYFDYTGYFRDQELNFGSEVRNWPKSAKDVLSRLNEDLGTALDKAGMSTPEVEDSARSVLPEFFRPYEMKRNPDGSYSRKFLPEAKPGPSLPNSPADVAKGHRPYILSSEKP